MEGNQRLPRLRKEQELLYGDEVYQIVGAAIEVHNQLGCGFYEAVYQEALEIELTQRSVPYKPQCELRIPYKGIILKKGYIADFLVEDKIIVEIKAINVLTDIDQAQVINYLKATGLKLAVLINFGAMRLDWHRIILSKNTNSH